MTDEQILDDLKRWPLRLVVLQIITLPLEITVYFQPPQWTVYLLFILSGIIDVATLSYVFVKEANKTKLGVSGHLANEKKFIILEIPNILQIVGVLGLLSFYLKDVEQRALVALFTALLLSLYLKHKRMDFLKVVQLKNKQDVSIKATGLIHALVSTFIGVIIFIAAELLGRQ